MHQKKIKEKSKKGFTLAEIMAVIILLGIILGITIPTVNKMISDGKQKAYSTQIEVIKKATYDWGLQNTKLLPLSGDSVTIYLGELKSAGNVPINITNPKTGNLFSNMTSITITNVENNYRYYVNAVDIEIVEETDIPTLIIEGDLIDYVEVNQDGIIYTIPKAVAHTSSGTPIDSSNISYQIIKSGIEVSSVDTSKIGTYQIKYSVSYQGKTGIYEKQVIVRDTTAPNIEIGDNLIINSSDFNSIDFMMGVVVSDNSGETLVPKIKSQISNIEGNYYVFYTVTDSSGNTITKRREVTVFNIYTITINKNSGGNVTVNKTTARPGDVINVEVTLEGYYYLNSLRYNGIDIKDSKTFVMPNENVVITANFLLPTYTLTFNPNGGNVSETSKVVTYGSQYGTLPTPTRTGYTFAGWYTAISGGTKVNSSDYVYITSDKTLYAQWTPINYTIYFNGNGGSVSPGSKLVAFGTAYGTLPTPTRTGYTFKGWYNVTTGGIQFTASTVLVNPVNHTLYAQWTPTNYILDYNPDFNNFGADFGSGARVQSLDLKIVNEAGVTVFEQRGISDYCNSYGSYNGTYYITNVVYRNGYTYNGYSLRNDTVQTGSNLGMIYAAPNGTAFTFKHSVAGTMWFSINTTKSILVILEGGTSYYGSPYISNLDGGPAGYGTNLQANGWHMVTGTARAQSSLPNYISFAGYSKICFNVIYNDLSTGAGIIGFNNNDPNHWVHAYSTYYNSWPGNTGTTCLGLSGAGGYVSSQILGSGTTVISKIWLE